MRSRPVSPGVRDDPVQHELTSLIDAGLAVPARSTRETFECCFRDIARLAVVDLARAGRKLVNRCDSGGNQNMSGYTTGTNNELTSGGGYTFTYDKNGNTIGETQLSTGDSWTFGYDDRNRMISAVEKSSGGSILNQATYTYDALDRRIGVDDNGTQTWTVYNGSSADANPYADFNGSGTLLTRYVSGLAVDELFARTSSGGTTAWYLTDRLGSVRDIVNSSGTVIDHIVYDSYGNILSETSPSSGDRFKFAGMEWDAAIGQYYDHARSYDSAQGRFTTQDPIGFGAGDADLYRYVGNDPATSYDPSGTDSQIPPATPPGEEEFNDLEIQAALQAKVVQEAIARDFAAMQEMNKNRAAADRFERGAFILYNPKTHSYAVAHSGVNVFRYDPLKTHFQPQGPNVYQPDFSSGPLFGGYIGDNGEDLSDYSIIATYHTHPNSNSPTRSDLQDTQGRPGVIVTPPATGLLSRPFPYFIYGPGIGNPGPYIPPSQSK